MIGNVLAWIIFGALAGWIASIVSRTNERGGLQIRAILLGIVGALLGGLLVQVIAHTTTNSFNIAGLLVAIFVAAALIGLYKTLDQQN